MKMCRDCCSSALLEGLEDEVERPTFLHPWAEAVLKSKTVNAAEAEEVGAPRGPSDMDTASGQGFLP